MSQDVASDIPFGVRSIGNYKIWKNWRGRESLKRDVYQLHWCTDGNGTAVVCNNEYNLSAGDVFLYCPGDIHIIRAKESSIAYWWITIDGPLVNEILNTFYRHKFISQAGTCPEELFRQLYREIVDTSPFGQRKAAITGYTILSLAAGKPKPQKKQDTIVGQALEYINNDYMNPDMNINSIAEKVNIHRSRLSRIFHQKMKISMIDYVIALRINQAISLLRSTDMPISMIANLVGYSDADYFSKAFKKHTTHSPSGFRETCL